MPNSTIKIKRGSAAPAGWQKLDNVDAEVKGTLNEIVVSGDDNLGYTISIDPNLTLDCGTY